MDLPYITIAEPLITALVGAAVGVTVVYGLLIAFCRRAPGHE